MTSSIVDAVFADLPPVRTSPDGALLDALRGGVDDFDSLRCAQLFAGGSERARGAVAGALYRLAPDVAEAERVTRAAEIVAHVLAAGVHINGAEVVAVLLADAGVRQVFAYGGTSELPLCDAIHSLPGIALVNGRGDKESAFMAAGASLLRPNVGAAVLHAARGLTNAGGALADARRNEAGTVFVVGLPSTGSSRFLPPHGEAGLIEAMGHFARWSWEAPALPPEHDARTAAAVTYVRKAREAIAVAGRQPWGPVLFGVPQDLAESEWVPLRVLAQSAAPPAQDTPVVDETLVALVRAARRPVLLIDDYALRSPGIQAALDRFARGTGAAVVQLRYRRGLMLFERLHQDDVTNFVGWLNPYSKAHRAMLDDCDLFITVEDRNIYRRVVGDLPRCRKIAINTDPAKVLKNEYLGDDDLLVEGDSATVLHAISDALRFGESDLPAVWPLDELREGSVIGPEPPSDAVYEARRQIAGAVAGLLAGWSKPVLIDDSSMFGGLLTEHYDAMPRGLRIFGGHGGFVGAGLGYAIGAATAYPDRQVLCTLGDQAFTNSYQALVAAVQQRCKLLILVCNNGESVSLKKQGAASYGDIPRPYLDNAADFDYQRVAKAIGIHAERVAVPVGGPAPEVGAAVAELSAVLERSAAMDTTAMVELVLPADPLAWRGIWVVQGFEQAAVNAG